MYACAMGPKFLQLHPVICRLYYDLLAAAQPPPRLALNKSTGIQLAESHDWTKTQLGKLKITNPIFVLIF